MNEATATEKTYEIVNDKWGYCTDALLSDIEGQARYYDTSVHVAGLDGCVYDSDFELVAIPTGRRTTVAG